MKQSGQGKSALPVNRAFVVQFRTETDLATGRVTGRVEHVASGQATHFSSLEELLAFIDRVLTSLPPPSAQTP